MVRSSAADPVVLESAGERSHDELLIDAARQAAAGPLMEALLHDVRNPLNALAINLEVLTEKLKVETGSVPPSQEKNLKAMREQIQRVDELMKKFAPFLAPRSFAAPESAVGEAVQAALDVIAPELRRKRLKVRVALEQDVGAAVDSDSLRFLCLQSVLRAVTRSEQGGEISVSLRRGSTEVVLEVTDTCGGTPEGVSGHEAALSSMAARLGGRTELTEGRTLVALPVAVA